MGELGSDGAMLPWFLLVMFFHLPLAIWLSLMLAVVALSDVDFSVMQACAYLCSWDIHPLCVHRYVSTPGRSDLLWLFLDM